MMMIEPRYDSYKILKFWKSEPRDSYFKKKVCTDTDK